MAGSLQELADEDEPIASINIIPFVDIVLVLLIIFLLTANLIAKESIPVELPRAANASETVDPTINLVITAAGELFLDGAAVSAEALRGRVAERFRAEPRLRAVVAADRAVRYDSVVQVIDALKDAGIVSFALNIERTPRR
jgi:biopolymer transport protein ExbD